MNLSNKSELIKYLKANYLFPKKGMGQNFLINEGVLDKMIEASEIKSTDTVLEIGPGLGVLTDKLIEKAGKVIAVEKDDRLSIILRQKESCKLEIVHADVLDLDPNKLMPKAYKLIANIPYYITGQIFRKFLGAENKPETIVMLVQKEVAERICAKPRSTSSGQAGKMTVLSVSVQAYGVPEIIDIVKASSFFPSPKIDSAIIKIQIKNDELGGVDENKFFRCVKHGFSSKRKTLVNNLSAGYQLPKKVISEILKKNNLGQNSRAQELSVKDWLKLAVEL